MIQEELWLDFSRRKAKGGLKEQIRATEGSVKHMKKANFGEKKENSTEIQKETVVKKGTKMKLLDSDGEIVTFRGDGGTLQ